MRNLLARLGIGVTCVLNGELVILLCKQPRSSTQKKLERVKPDHIFYAVLA